MKILLLFFIMTMTYGRVPQDPSYVVKYIGGDVITQGELDNYIKATRLNDALRVALFKNSENFQDYQNNLSKFLKSKQEQALKDLAYLRVLEIEAIKQNPRRRRPRNSNFTLKDQEVFRNFQEYESEVLKELLDQRMGIRKAMDIFGGQLQAKGYPHFKDESATDTYLRWRENEINRIEFEMLTRDARQFERAIVFQTYKRQIKVDPIEVMNRKIDFLEKAKILFPDGTYSREQLLELTQQNSELRAVIGEFRIFDLKDTPLNRFDQKILEEQTEQWWSKFSSYQDNLSADKLIAFHRNILNIAAKYETEDKLREMSDAAKEIFVRETDYEQLLMSKLYNLARLSIKLNPELNEQLILNEYEVLKELINFDFVLNSRAVDKNLEAHIRYQLSLRTQGIDLYHKELLGLGHWLYLFELRKSLSNLRPFLRVSYHEEANYDSYKALESQMKKERFETAIEEYRKKLQNRYHLSN